MTAIAAVAAGIFTACLAPIACAPAMPTPAMTPCEGTHLIIHGFDSSPGCDLTPPQELHVVVEHPAPWTPVQTDTFYVHCANAGGTVTDTEGDAWRCDAIDY